MIGRSAWPRMISVLFASGLLGPGTLPLSAELRETAGPYKVLSPERYGASDSGTYYHPTILPSNNYFFLFTQGGQFSAATTPQPLEWCKGDKIILWRAARTLQGLTAPGEFTPLLRVSPCEVEPGNPAPIAHWTMTSAHYSGDSGTINLIAEKQVVHGQTGAQLSTSLWLFRGVFTQQGSSIGGWQRFKLFDTIGGPGRVESFVLAGDTSSTPPPDGYSHELFRGFARVGATKTVEFRMDLSESWCDNSSAVEICASIEFKRNGIWKRVLAGVLDFVPQTLLFSFRPNNLVLRGGQLELWGVEILTDSTGAGCPCATTQNKARFGWFAVNPSTFALTGSGAGKPFALESSVRCMPADPHTTRMGVDVVTLPGGAGQYLLTGQNDDQACTSSRPFVGIDIVTTRIE